MLDKLIFSAVILAAVLIVAVSFVYKALHYRRRMKSGNTSYPGGEMPLPASCRSVSERYMARYIGVRHTSFRSTCRVRIRPAYYERIRSIVHDIGGGEVSITAYIDKVLAAHFEDNEAVIGSLCGDSMPDSRRNLLQR